MDQGLIHRGRGSQLPLLLDKTMLDPTMLDPTMLDKTMLDKTMLGFEKVTESLGIGGKGSEGSKRLGITGAEPAANLSNQEKAPALGSTHAKQDLQKTNAVFWCREGNFIICVVRSE